MSYEKYYSEWKKEPLKFWEKKAENIHWFKKWDNTLHKKNDNTFEWFHGGLLNTCYNCRTIQEPIWWTSWLGLDGQGTSRNTLLCCFRWNLQHSLNHMVSRDPSSSEGLGWRCLTCFLHLLSNTRSLFAYAVAFVFSAKWYREAWGGLHCCMRR